MLYLLSALLVALLLAITAVTAYTLWKVRNMHLLVYSLKDDIARLASTSLNDLFNQLSITDDLTTSTMQQNLERWKKEFPELHAENKFVEKQCAVLRKSTA